MDNNINKFIRKFKIDKNELKIIECPNLKKPISTLLRNKDIIVGKFEKSDCIKCRYKKKCRYLYKKDHYEVEINVNDVLENVGNVQSIKDIEYKKEKNLTIDIVEKFNLEIVDKLLKYVDNVYLELQDETEQYFNNTFNVHIEELKRIVDKAIIMSSKSVNEILNRYLNTWIEEFVKYFSGFENKVFGFTMVLFEEKMQAIFNYLYLECFSEQIARKKLMNFNENLFNDAQGYIDIYYEEYFEYVKSFIKDNADTIDKAIRDCLEENNKNTTYEYNDIFDKKNITEHKYIDKYQELNKMAERKGFVHVRNNGDHGVFINRKSNKVIVIPQGRKIGKGLSFLIQKQIFQEKCVLKHNKEVDSPKKSLRDIEYEKLKKRLKNLEVNKDINEYEKLADEYPHICNLSSVGKAKILELKEINFIQNKLNPLIAKMDIKTCIEEMKKFLKKYPNSVQIIGRLGAAYDIEGDDVNALKYFMMYVEMDGNDYDAYNSLINVLVRNGRVEESKTYLAIRNMKFSKKIDLVERIKTAIMEVRYKDAIKLIEELEKENINTLSADDFAEISEEFFYAHQYELARKYCRKTLEFYPQKQEALMLIYEMDRMNV